MEWLFASEFETNNPRVAMTSFADVLLRKTDEVILVLDLGISLLAVAQGNLGAEPPTRKE